MEAPNCTFLDGLIFCGGAHCRTLIGSYDGHCLVFVNVRRARYALFSENRIVDDPVIVANTFTHQYIINGSYYDASEFRGYGSVTNATDLRVPVLAQRGASSLGSLSSGNRGGHGVRNRGNRGSRANRGNRRYRRGPSPQPIAGAVGPVAVGSEVDIPSRSPPLSPYFSDYSGVHAVSDVE